MNTSKSDKARMLTWIKPGKIAEIGPGGGAVLDLLQEQFPASQILGIDASQRVVSALERKKEQEKARWNIIKGDASDLPRYFGPSSLNSVIFCSVLHEVYSYTLAEDGTRFRMESVQNVLRAAFDAIMPGGRIVIRDGIMPPHAIQRMEFLVEDAKTYFEAFCKAFEGRTLNYRYLSENQVEIASADAMEFLYTYTWGPQSFPYEVREQYGIMTYDDYCKSILHWLGKEAHLIPLPEQEACYLQQGYVDNLKHKVRLMDASGKDVDFPPSNAIIVIEKSLAS